MGSLALLRQPISEKENSEIKSIKLRLKIDFVSHSTSAGELGKYILVAGHNLSGF